MVTYESNMDLEKLGYVCITLEGMNMAASASIALERALGTGPCEVGRFEVFVDIDICRAGALIKCIVANRPHGARYGDRHHRYTLIKSVCADGSNTLLNDHMGDIVT